MTSTSVRLAAGCLAAALLAAPARAQAPVVDVSAPARVSSDLLGPSAPAQPETQAEPHVAVNPANPAHMVAGWQEQRYADGGARALGVARSTDGGATWTDGLVPRLTTANGGTWDRASDPWVAFGPDNRVYFASLLFNTRDADNAVGVSVSEDGGRTWGSPVLVRKSNPNFNDKEAITVDTNAQSPGFGTVYAAWDVNARRTERTAQRLVVARSTDGGLTWSAPVTVRRSRGNVGVVPKVGPDGTLYLVWAGTKQRGQNFRVFFAKSTDQGRTWSTPRDIETIRFNGVQGYRSGSFLPSFDVDAATGTLYVAWSDARWTGSDQATIVESRDGGATWSEARRVSDGPDASPVFTVTLAAAGGSVGVGYYSLRNDPARDAGVDVYLNVSTDGGATYLPAVRVTRESFDARFAARAGSSRFLGDYIGLAASQGSFGVVWVGTQLQSATNPSARQPDVFAARATAP